MTIRYNPGGGDELPYYYARNPTEFDLEHMVFQLGDRDFYNFVVTGKPKKVSPEWIAKHPGYEQGQEYDYAVSYSIYTADVEAMLDHTDNPLDAFNYYLEGTGKEWIEIYEIKLVDRVDPWENTM